VAPVAKNLRKYRHRRGWTQATFAQRL